MLRMAVRRWPAVNRGPTDLVQAHAIFEAIFALPSFAIRLPQATPLMRRPAMTKPITLTNRFVDTAFMVGTTLVLFVNAQLLILPPHFV
jgi:hypothetical protein